MYVSQDIAAAQRSDAVVEERSALGGLYRAITFRIPSGVGGDYETVLHHLSSEIVNVIRDILGHGIKCYLGCSLTMKKLIETETSNFGFNTEATAFLQSSDIKAIVDQHIARLLERIDKHVREGSGWFCVGVNSIDLFVSR